MSFAKLEAVNGEAEQKSTWLQPCAGRAGEAAGLGLRAAGVSATTTEDSPLFLWSTLVTKAAIKQPKQRQLSEGGKETLPMIPAKLLHPTILAKAVSVPSAKLQLNLCPNTLLS